MLTQAKSAHLLTALKANFVPFVTAGELFLRGVNGLGARWTFGRFHHFERHLDALKATQRLNLNQCLPPYG